MQAESVKITRSCTRVPREVILANMQKNPLKALVLSRDQLFQNKPFCIMKDK